MENRLKRYNESGALLLVQKPARQSAGEEISLDVSALSPGTYLLKIETPKGVIVKKLVK